MEKRNNVFAGKITILLVAVVFTLVFSASGVVGCDGTCKRCDLGNPGSHQYPGCGGASCSSCSSNCVNGYSGQRGTTSLTGANADCNGVRTWKCEHTGAGDNTQWAVESDVWPGSETSCDGGMGSCDGSGDCISPIAYYKFDDNVEDSVGDNNGTIHGGAGFVGGMKGSALSFDGVDDWVEIADSESNDILGAQTITAWIKPNRDDVIMPIVNKDYKDDGGTTTRSFNFKLSPLGYLGATIIGSPVGSGYIHRGTGEGIIEIGEWTYVAFTYTGGRSATDIKVYVNGVQSDTISYSGGSFPGRSDNYAPIYIGLWQYSSNKEKFDGLIDEVKIYGKALTDEQIKADYDSYFSDLVLDCKFDEGYGEIVYDSSQYENDGALINNPEWVEGVSGSALKFDGVDDYVSVGDKDNFDGTNTLTISLWAKFNSFGGGLWASTIPLVNKHFSGYENNSRSSYQFLEGATNTNQLYMAVSDGGATYPIVTYPHNMNTGKWYHLATTFNFGTLTLYINGLEVNSTSSNVTSIQNGIEPLYIGEWYHQYSSDYKTFNGSMDELKIYRRALTADEIKELYSLGKDIPEITNATWQNMKGEEIDHSDDEDWVQIILGGVFKEGQTINYSIIKDDESGEAVTDEEYDITSLDESRGFIKLPWKSEYNLDDEPYYFKIVLGGETIDSRTISPDYDGLLQVGNTPDDSPTEIKILSPATGEIYLSSNNITFNAIIRDEDTIFSQATWNFGELVNMISPEVVSVSSYSFAEEDISLNEVKGAYTTAGQKNVIMTVTNSETGETTSNQVEILVVDDNSDFVMAFISSPEEKEYFYSQAGVVNGSAEASYIIKSESGILTCLFGTCPTQTSGTNPVSITNWNSAPALDSTDNLEFKWEIIGGLSWTRTGTQSESVRFYKYFPMGERQIKLTLNYYEASILKASSAATRTFVVADFYEIVCSQNEAVWYYPNGTLRSSLENCLLNGSICCPSNYDCLDNNLDEVFSCEAEIPDETTCNRYLTEDECEIDQYQEWEKIIGAGQRTDGLLCSLGDNVYEVNGTSYHLNCYCEWDNATCENKFELIEDQNEDPDWPGNKGGLKPKLGSCTINKDSAGDDCEDGFLEYGWTATYSWPTKNSFDSKEACENVTGAGKCLQHPIGGAWRYDPVKESSECVAGSNMVICPAKVQLPFFNFWNVLMGLIILIVIYSYLSFKQK